MNLLTTELYFFHSQTEMQMTWNNHQTRAQKQFFAFPQLVIVIIFRNLRQFTKLLSAAAGGRKRIQLLNSITFEEIAV